MISQHNTNRMFLKSVIVCTCVIITIHGVFGIDPTVTIRQGTMRGSRMYSENRNTIVSFLGIPYAQPPVGPLRFAAPEYHQGWGNEVFAATKFGPACAQPEPSLTSSPQSEDCLTLNVWVAESVMKYNRQAPVVIILEGEGFVFGDPSRFPAHDLASESVIVVSVNYRLNVFGFLCLEAGEGRCNLGLLDQYLALVWVRENIGNFGGDPSSVTLAGHSAGAASVLLHMISPRTQGLFDGGIIMSGSVLSPWMISNDASAGSRAIARSLGCLAAPLPRYVVACLRTKTTDQLLRAFDQLYQNGNWTDLPLPAADGFLPPKERYLPDPIGSLRSGAFRRLPLLVGVTSLDGDVALGDWRGLVEQPIGQAASVVESAVLPSILSRYNSSKSTLRQLVAWHYLQRRSTSPIDAVVHAYSDSMFWGPHIAQLETLVNSTFTPPIFAYIFTQPHVGLHAVNTSSGNHGGEMVMLMGQGVMQAVAGRRFSGQEERLSTVIRRAWTDFIRTRSLGSYGEFSWSRYTTSERRAVLLGPSGEDSIVWERKLGAALWNSLIPTLASQPLPPAPTQPPTLSRLGGAYRSATYTLLGFVVALLALLVVAIALLRRRWRERAQDF